MTNEEKMREVPFGHSMYQIQRFIANNETPERTYRNVLLQIDQKQKALKACSFRRRRLEIDLQEIEEKLPNAVGYDYDRLMVDLEEKEYNLNQEIKLIEDAIIEIKIYEDVLSKLPEFTREEFEGGEKKYWQQRLLGDARREIQANGTVGPGTLDSLEKIGLVPGRVNGAFTILEDYSDLEPKRVRELIEEMHKPKIPEKTEEIQ
jgi:hypothetical protein